MISVSVYATYYLPKNLSQLGFLISVVDGYVDKETSVSVIVVRRSMIGSDQAQSSSELAYLTMVVRTSTSFRIGFN